MRAKLAARTDGDVVFENTARANFGPRADENKGTDFTVLADDRIRGDHRAWVDAGLWLSRWVEQTSNANETRLRCRRSRSRSRGPSSSRGWRPREGP